MFVGCEIIHDGLSPVVYWFRYAKVFVSLSNAYEATKEVYPPARIVKFTMV